MKNEIRQYMNVVDQHTAEFNFPETFTGFQGHFPESPILPGICMIQAAEIVAEHSMGSDRKTVKNAKFFSPVTPNTRITIEARAKKNIIEATITSGQQKNATIKFMVNHDS